MNNPLFLLFVT